MSLANVYKNVQVKTASPERVMVMLFQAASRHMAASREALAKRDTKVFFGSLERAAQIVIELQSTLKPEQAPKLCEELRELYGFVIARLTRAAVTRDAKYIREAERAFAPVADAFAQAVGQATAAKSQAQARP